MEAVQFHNGARVHFRTRTGSSGRGLECNLLLLDEALELDPDEESALEPQTKRAVSLGRGQIWYVSSAGHGNSLRLRDIRDAGRDNAWPGIYLEWAAPRESDPYAPETWAMACPSLGAPFLSEAAIRSSMSLPLETFGREYLGYWTDQTAMPYLPHGSWEQCGGDPIAIPGARAALGVELQDYGRAAALVAAIACQQGAWVHTVQRWESAGALDLAVVAEEIAQHAKSLKAPVSGDDFTVAPILDLLAGRGIRTLPLNSTGVREASASLLNAVTGQRVVHPRDPRTDIELVNAGQAPTGDGGTRLSRRNSTGLSVAAFAAAAAVHTLLGPPIARARVITLPRD